MQKHTWISFFPSLSYSSYGAFPYTKDKVKNYGKEIAYSHSVTTMLKLCRRGKKQVYRQKCGI